ncbi:MAG TPA: LytTR family DNA-binding domain-containing protein [Chitinophagaceae bacterium]|jgi:DNA-binding LytR/AlgR family response regulator|nr:LytTR family DNA-binding domain-containing protein [Chitinophagaceae bacterium]
MEKYNCLIVEDEPLAAEILEDYIRQIAFLELKGICHNAISAMELLQQTRIDCIFLDIHLPKIKGIDFIRTLKHPPQIIITTAYQEYALQGYELNVIDYLLKPIEFNRFLMAVNKIKPTVADAPRADYGLLPSAAGNEKPYLFFNVSKKKVKIYVEDILYIESLKEYIKIVTPGKSIVTKFQLNQLEELLAKGQFIRIHRSFIVAKSRVDAFSATEVEVAGKEIPIGRSYKEFVLSQLAPSH